MASESALLNLYVQVAPTTVFRLLQKQAGKISRNGIFSARLVVWMMMSQRLQTGGSLARSVEQLHQGRFDPLLSQCKRVREKRMGLGTGGYCQARQKLPTIVVRRSVTELIERLRQRITEEIPNGHPRMYVVDGSSLQLEYSPELAKVYPQADGIHKSHRLIVRLVVLHDVETGLAEQPYWGPMYGRKAVSEQALAERAMEHVPAGAVLMGDRNFGIFSTAYHAQQHGLGVIARLTKVRATALDEGKPISRQGDWPVQWRSSRWDRAKHPGWPPDAQVSGRLIAWRVGRGKHKQWLYLFTTLEAPAAQVVEWYGKRWRIETDLRSLKQTVRLSQLQVRSADMVEKELLVAVLAYNLVRTIMHLAAQRSGSDPRQLSFTYSCNIVLDGCPAILATRGDKQQQALDRIIELVARCKLPKRHKARHYPRAVWSRGFRFPLRKEGEN
jgi:hypothetical protein